MTYRIQVKALDGTPLTFRGVKSYRISEGYLHFIDQRTGQKKMFATPNTAIEEE